ncbi:MULTISPECIES: hypothetical protein [unclassified Anabaena]|uniref:hypothetical protein n=1 Tax=unclassified Anabaena TaxID=2619674 RepID=UPI0012E8EE6A|nr:MULTISPECIES: hypothetical protein [unclassified Anabaena]
MNKFIRGFITIEKSLQVLALLGLILFLGYLGFEQYRSDSTPSVPINSPTIQK